MTDERLNELETVCRDKADKDGKVKLRAGDVLELVRELRELRQHAADLNAHEGTIAHLHRLVTRLGSYAEGTPSAGLTPEGGIAIQDPGR
jgi:hypothetical protein